jgi:type IV fimbrial biogenesis protein FimT
MGMKTQQGYTLIELMVLVAVMSIVLAVGVPQLSTFFDGNRMVSNTNALVSAIQITRSEAIKRGNRVTLCKSSNADAGTPACTTGGDWDQGWFVFSDSPSSIGVYNSATEGVPLRRFVGAEGSNTTITTSDNIIANYISFTSRGVPKTANGGAQSGTFQVCDDRGLTNAAGNVIARGIVLSASGRVRLSKDSATIGSCP